MSKNCDRNKNNMQTNKDGSIMRAGGSWLRALGTPLKEEGRRSEKKMGVGCLGGEGKRDESQAFHPASAPNTNGYLSHIF